MAMAIKNYPRPFNRDVLHRPFCEDSDKVPEGRTSTYILSISYRHEHESGDPEHEVEEEHGVLHTGGDVRESAGDPSPGSHSSSNEL